jgi:hypothetical protein
MSYGGGGGSGGVAGYSDAWHGPRPAYSSSSSSASSDVGSAGGYPHESMYRSGGPMPRPQPQHHPHPYASQPQPQMTYNNNNNNNNKNKNNGSNNGSNYGSNNNLSHLHGMEQLQPGYTGGRAGSGTYGQAWPAPRKGSAAENGSGDSGYSR